MRFVHTSDWQIGKTFGFADEAAQSLRDERLEAISRLGQLARTEGASAILVAGDVYDVETPLERTLRQPVERMRAFADIEWHLIPGNHDPHTPRGPWERLRKLGLPANVHLHLSPEPASIAAGAAWLLPGVLTRRHADADPTAAMNTAATPEGALRIGLAHGSVRSFGTDPASTHNLIAPDRPAQAGLAYLALGDWHGAQDSGDRCWYSGTPETDDFSTGGGGGGEALVVEIDSALAPPAVTRHRVGRFRWHRLEAALHQGQDIDLLEARLRGLAPDDLGAVLVWLKVSGALSLAELERFESRIRDGTGSALRVLRLDSSELLPHPTDADLEAIDHAGFVRAAADRLAARAADAADPEQAVAAAALQRLYLLHMRWSGNTRR
jgi:DNA repair exonuclease SbcCD nuclease subunit